MSIKYELVGHITFSAGNKVFKSGEEYTAEQVGDLVEYQTEDGEDMFAALPEGTKASGKKSVTIGKKTKAVEEGGDDTGGDTGTAGKTVTL